MNDLLQPLVDCVNAAFNKASLTQRTLVGHHPGTMASVLSSMFEDEARTRIAALPGVALISRGRSFLVSFKGVLVRFKKVDPDYRTRNYPTDASLRFDHQVPLPGIPPHPRLTLGYRLNRLGTAIVDLALIFSQGKKVVWVHQLSGSAVVTQLSLAPAAASAKRKKRVKIRQNRRTKKES
jgi:hypothetical protein